MFSYNASFKNRKCKVRFFFNQAGYSISKPNLKNKINVFMKTKNTQQVFLINRIMLLYPTQLNQVKRRSYQSESCIHLDILWILYTYDYS